MVLLRRLLSSQRPRATLRVALVATLMAPTAACAATLDRTVWTSLGQVHDLRATFTETQDMSILREPLHSQGTVHFVRPAQLEWVVTAPARSTFSLQGTVVRTAYPDLGLEETLDLAQVPDANRLATSLLVWMTADVEAVERDFTVVYGDDELTLVPRDPSLAALVAELSLTVRTAPVRVVGVRIRQPNQDRVAIDFAGIVLDGVKVTDP